MKSLSITRRTALAFLSAGLLAQGQDNQTDRIAVPFRNPAQPHSLRVNLMQGSITVRGYDGKEVIVESRGNSPRSSRRRPSDVPDGMKRIDAGGYGLTVEEQNNVVTVESSPMHGNTELTIQVPFDTSLKLSCVNGGDITVERVRGEIDANNVNGGVRLTNVAGPVVAHALNKSVVVVFDQVPGGKAMSFSSMNGNVDVTMPADTKARLKMKSENGDIYSDFDVKLEPNATSSTVEDNRDRGGRYRVRFDRATFGTINGGGPELQLTTFNGRIIIRKK